MELRDGFMPLKCWKCELCDICCKFVELSSLQTFPTEIGIGGCEENSLFYRQFFMVAWVIIWQSNNCFVWGKKKQKINIFPLITCLPRRFTVYTQVAPCVAHQFRAWLLNLRAGRCRKGNSLWFPLISWIILCTTFRQLQALSAPQLSTFQPLHRQTSTSISVSGNKSKDKTLNNYNS